MFYEVWARNKIHEVIGSHAQNSKVVITNQVEGYVLVTRLPNQHFKKKFEQVFLAIKFSPNLDYSGIEEILENEIKTFNTLTRGLEIKDGRVYDWSVEDEGKFAIPEEWTPYTKRLGFIEELKDLLAYQDQPFELTVDAGEVKLSCPDIPIQQETRPKAFFHQDLTKSQLPIGEQVTIRELPYHGTSGLPKPAIA